MKKSLFISIMFMSGYLFGSATNETALDESILSLANDIALADVACVREFFENTQPFDIDKKLFEKRIVMGAVHGPVKRYTLLGWALDNLESEPKSNLGVDRSEKRKQIVTILKNQDAKKDIREADEDTEFTQAIWDAQLLLNLDQNLELQSIIAQENKSEQEISQEALNYLKLQLLNGIQSLK